MGRIKNANHYLLLILVLFINHSRLNANADLIENKKIHYCITKIGESIQKSDISRWPVYENFDWDDIAKGDQLNLAFTLNSGSMTEPCIWLNAKLERFKIFQDSTLLYATGLYPAIDPIVLKLHPKQGSTVIISSSFSSRDLSNNIFTIELGDYAELLDKAEHSAAGLIIEQFHIIVISGIILFFGLLSLVFFFVRWRDQNFAFLYYGIAVSMSAFVNIDIRLINLLIDLPNGLFTFMQLMGRFGVFTLFILFVRQIFDLGSKKIINNTLYATICYWGVAVFAFYFVSNPAVFSYLSLAYGVFALFILGIAVFHISKSKVMKELPDKQIFLFFVSLFLGIVIYSLGTVFLSMEAHRQVPIYLGVFAMSMAMLSLLIGRYVQSERDVYNYQIELEKNKNELLKLKQANIEAQYETLKSQLNPHFLFNNLSTLSSLVYPVANPEKAKIFIDEFSKIFRYLLDIQSKNLVTLAEELDFLKSYIFLQQLRFTTGLNCNIKVDSSNMDKVLPPMAVQMLVENAIKHNLISKEKPLTIDIYNKDNILVVKNNLHKKYKNENETTQLGLKNLKDRYSFYNVVPEIIELIDSFFVKIPLLVNEHV